ncbi:MAG TPA: sulfotransferase domain-containing protein [Acidimicrobiales bacterium]|nr:sulfotransferase domain-containing protein [Acidimicrobiales bacterium]
MGAAGSSRLPNTLIIGAQKCGTSALHRQLAAHPDVFTCARKEPHFFSHNHGQPRDVDAYRRLFDGAGDARVVLEASTTYTMFPLSRNTPELIRETLGPEVRLIYCMREPLARIRAGYIHSVAAGTESRPIDVAVMEDLRLLTPSLYALQLERYLAVFPRERILCLQHEAMRRDPEGALDETLRFLGLDASWRPDTFDRVNVSSEKRAPRGWWRRLGGLTFRPQFSWLKPVVQRLSTHTELVTRPIRDDETVMSEDVADALLVLIRDDLRRLQTLLGDGWDWNHLASRARRLTTSTSP